MKPKKMNKRRRYYFDYIDTCNMCGSDSSEHKLLGKRLNRSQGKNPKKMGITTTVVKCTNCGLIFSNPQPVPFDIQDHYGVSPESYWREEYFTVTDDYFQGEIGRLRELLEIKSGMRSLDIGAGLGKQMIVLSNCGFEAYGLEASKQFYQRAISKMGVAPERLELGVLEEASYPEDHFEFISFGAVLEHLYDPSDSIVRAMKWLKPNGIMHIEVPSSSWLIAKLINLFYALTRTDYVTNLSPMHEPYHLYEFGLESFQRHSEKHGYELAFHEYYVCRTSMPKAVDYFLKPYMRWTNTGMQLCVWLRKK